MFADATGQGWKFALVAVPEDIPTEAKSMFDRKRMGILFTRGREMGETGNPWKSSPPFIEPVDPGLPTTRAVDN